MSLISIASPPPDAAASIRGVVNTTTQTFGGAKTFNSVVTLGAGLASAGDLSTQSDKALSIGSPTFRWSTIWAMRHAGAEQGLANAASQTINTANGGVILIQLGPTATTSVTANVGYPGEVMTTVINQDGNGTRTITGWDSAKFLFTGGTFVAATGSNASSLIEWKWIDNFGLWVEQVRSNYSVGGGGTVSSVATNATLTGGPITSTGTLGINLSNANSWLAAQTFSPAISGTGVVSIENTSTSGYSAAMFFDSSNNYKGEIGYGNASVANTGLQGRNYIFTDTGGPDWYFQYHNTARMIVGMQSGLVSVPGQLAVGHSNSNSFTADFRGAKAADVNFSILNTDSTGFGGFRLADDGNNQRGSFGHGNASAALTYAQNTNFFYSDLAYGDPWVWITGSSRLMSLFAGTSGNMNLGSTTTDPSVKLRIEAAASSAGIELGNGASLAVSPTNTGRLRYNSGTQVFEQSTNGTAWTGLGGGITGSLTSGRIPYATGAGTLADSANLLWDNSHGQLQVIQNALATNPTPAIEALNNTAALVGAQVQISPLFIGGGQGWSTTAVASETVNNGWYVRPIAGAHADAEMVFLSNTFSGLTEMVHISKSYFRPGADLSITIGDSTHRPKEVWGARYAGVEQTIANAATVAVSTISGDYVRIALGATATTSVTINNGYPGEVVTMAIVQDATGGRTITGWSSSFVFKAGTFTATTTANNIDILVWQWDNATSKWIEQSRTNFASQSAHAVFVGPTSGTAAPTFRALATADIPKFGLSGIYNQGTTGADNTMTITSAHGGGITIQTAALTAIGIPFQILGGSSEQLVYIRDDANTSVFTSLTSAGQQAYIFNTITYPMEGSEIYNWQHGGNRVMSVRYDSSAGTLPSPANGFSGVSSISTLTLGNGSEDMGMLQAYHGIIIKNWGNGDAANDKLLVIDTAFAWASDTARLLQINNNAVEVAAFKPTGELQISSARALGTAVTYPASNGLTIANTTAAANNTQQVSPILALVGQGWKTTVTAASQEVRWGMKVLPIQGTTNPSSQLDFMVAVNGGAYSVKHSIMATGGLVAPTIGTSTAIQHTLPAVTSDTIALIAATQTLTNKTLTSATLTTPTLTGGIGGTYSFGGTPTLLNGLTTNAFVGPNYGGTASNLPVMTLTAVTGGIGYLNSWADAGSGSWYFKDAFGQVHLFLNASHTGASAATIFTLPAGFRPKFSFNGFVAIAGIGTPGCLSIDTSGNVLSVTATTQVNTEVIFMAGN